MRIDLVFPVLPPTLDGIGDHTAHLATALSEQGCEVRVHTAQREWTPLPGVRVQRSFHAENRRGILELVDAVRSDPPDWLLLQFNQFSYGRWGLNPFVPLAIWRIRQCAPEAQIAVMFHEDFVPSTNWRNAMMSVWQRLQFWSLGRQANVVGFSIQPWTERYRPWFPQAEVTHWPVGSNIPNENVSYAQARKRLGIEESTFVAGVFGSLHNSRLMGWIRRSVCSLDEQGGDSVLLYVGPDGDTLRKEISGVQVQDAGPLPAEDVSIHLSAMDLHLSPFVDGASTRRGSFLAGLQHGTPTVSTYGPLTDPMLRDHEGQAFMLTPHDDPSEFERAVTALYHDSGRRLKMASAAQRYFEEHFRWDAIADNVLKSFRNQEL